VALVKRHWKLAAINVLLLVVCVLLVVHQLSSTGVKAQESGTPTTSPSPIDSATYRGVSEVRRHLALSNEALAAVGCSQTIAQQALVALREWYGQNKSTWEQLGRQRGAEERRLREVQRLINVGPRDESVLAQVPTIEQRIEALSQQRAQLLQNARLAVSAYLSPDQNAVWAASQANSEAAAPYRYVSGISSADVKTLSDTMQRYGAGSPEMAQVEQSLIAGSKQVAAQNVIVSIGQNLSGVIAAERAVLGGTRAATTQSAIAPQ
jgi:hypothetical protein